MSFQPCRWFDFAGEFVNHAFWITGGPIAELELIYVEPPMRTILKQNRIIGEERRRFPLAQMFVVARTTGAKQVSRPRILHKVASRSAQCCSPYSRLACQIHKDTTRATKFAKQVSPSQKSSEPAA
ncbi:hypothetical protein [Novipirellula herctigrandis]|uniref:hypothetical protein n=1 Tax=Novipirellula herctigrandis TaxID=2527986 RepID=UPI003AF3DFD5